jgi:hypothetical protein
MTSRKARSKQSKESDSDNQKITGRKASILSGDCEALQEWNTAITHHVDLEGISTEGYGYSVTISGPGPKSKTRRRMPKFPSFSQDSSVFSKPTRTSSSLRPVKTTEVTVRESYEAPGCPGRQKFWQKLDENSENVNPQNMEFLTGFDSLGDDQQANPLQHLSRNVSPEIEHEAPPSPFGLQAVDNSTQTKPQVSKPLTFYDDGFQDDDNHVEALPRLPKPSHQERGRGS